MTLSKAEIRELKGRAQRLEPVLKVGRNGVTPAFVASLDEALKQHELIKIKFVEHKEEKKALAQELAAQSGSEVVTIVGNVAVFYRPRAVKA